MGRRKETVTVYLEPEQAARPRRLNAATKVPTSVRLRDAVDAYLDVLERDHANALAALPGPVEK